ncbi:outer membrane protein assembly factor BamE [Candidatus Persebacteraceae bacterium Df01]|jgi:outer membrane protein assembly factor BamE (lipoprotein component of BamABCDE complex)|uniref:Outer membrane protein assembly factor BamE n=1 Tax=Candidatus Doriopsillibacter californiensis TaxID=2970740 RepID=A0ABT7QL44_9GAMM|nr:outer membrane protein assembly factor BamE [Candidatus Persebacteraceae bacterium Df01]
MLFIQKKRCAIVVVIAVFLSSCSYKSEIRQGSDTLPDKISQLSLGMTQSEIIAILGKSRVPSVFESDSWIYYYQRRIAGFLPKTESLGVELEFKNGKLDAINHLVTKNPIELTEPIDSESAEQ